VKIKENKAFKGAMLKEYIKSNLADPWTGSQWQGYRYLDNKQKGELGERFVDQLMRDMGHDVDRATSSTAGHDRVVDGILTEIKFSLAQTSKDKTEIKDDTFIMNHVGENKDWERLIFVGINKNKKSRMRFITKEDFKKVKENFFRPQQGGMKAKNDDWICGSKRLIALLESEYSKELTEW
jgi:hypothetical protein